MDGSERILMCPLTNFHLPPWRRLRNTWAAVMQKDVEEVPARGVNVELPTAMPILAARLCWRFAARSEAVIAWTRMQLPHHDPRTLKGRRNWVGLGGGSNQGTNGRRSRYLKIWLYPLEPQLPSAEEARQLKGGEVKLEKRVRNGQCLGRRRQTTTIQRRTMQLLR